MNKKLYTLLALNTLTLLLTFFLLGFTQQEEITIQGYHKALMYCLGDTE